MFAFCCLSLNKNLSNFNFEIHKKISKLSAVDSLLLFSHYIFAI